MNNAFSLSSRLAANASAQPQDVLAAKTLLQRLGYYEAPDWGLSPYPDPALFNAVRAFQTAQGLDSDGMMDRGGETEAALHNAAKHLQSMGRNGDTLLAHITPAEARLLDAVTDGGSINPTTGLLEFWGRMGGSKYSREQRDKTGAGAETNAASLGGDTGNNTQNEGGGSRQRTYTDAQLAGAAKANEEAARTRDKVRNYLGRDGASANGGVTPGIDARASQQADAPRTTEPTRRHEQDTTAAAIARSYAAAKLNKNPSTGLLTPKSAPAPSANRSAATPTPTTPALSSLMHRAQNAAATTTATTATATTPADPGVDPSWGPSATPAQQARNIKQTRQFSEQQRAAEANANATAARTRQTVKDYLGKTQSTRTPTTAARRPHATIPQGGTAKGVLIGRFIEQWRAERQSPFNKASEIRVAGDGILYSDPRDPSIINRALNSVWSWTEKDKQNNLTDPRNNPHGVDVSIEAVKAAIASVAIRDTGTALSTFGDLNPTPVGKIVAPVTGPIGSMMEDVGNAQIRNFLDDNWVARTKQKLDPKNRR